MPELPEVETMRRGVLSIVGAQIVSAKRTACAKKPIQIKPRIDHLARRLANTRIVAVDRLGKRVVIQNNHHDRLVFEPRMTGLVLIGSPPNREHLRFELKLRSNQVDRLWFWDRRGLGTITCYNERQYDELKNGGSLGPDALQVQPEQLRERMKTSKQPIKVALLDQKKILGVGNLYASEILHRCRIDPRTKCDRLTRAQWSLIHQKMLDVLNRAIESEGSTLSDGTYRNALNDPGSFQNQHLVYDRAGQRCYSCRRDNVIRIVQAQRSTFYCPRCQSRSRKTFGTANR